MLFRSQAGFTAVTNRITGLHLWCPSGRRELHGLVDYLLGFLSPELEALLAAAPSPQQAALIAEGYSHFRRLADRDDASLSICAYQGRGLAGQ